jgi:basic amino acid/polyamine antiporter, APA family
VKLLGKVSSKRQTPGPALILSALLAAAFVLPGDLKSVALVANFFVFLTFILVNVAVIRLRVKNKKVNRPYRIPFTIKNIPVIPVLAIVMTVLLGSFTVYALLSGNSVE